MLQPIEGEGGKQIGDTVEFCSAFMRGNDWQGKAGSAKSQHQQISRLLCLCHNWTSTTRIARQYKALSLVIHCPPSTNMELHLLPDHDMNPGLALSSMSRDNVSTLFQRFEDTGFPSPSPRPTAAYSSGRGLHLPIHSGLDTGGSDKGSPPRAVDSVVVEPLVVDTLANDFRLDQQQRANLHTFVKARNLCTLERG